MVWLLPLQRRRVSVALIVLLFTVAGCARGATDTSPGNRELLDLTIKGISKSNHRRLLDELYAEVLGMPEKVQEIDEIMSHFDSRHDVMWELLLKKYPVEVSGLLDVEKQRKAENAEKMKPVLGGAQEDDYDDEKDEIQQQDEMEQELIDFYAQVAPSRMENVPDLVRKHFHRRGALERLLLKKYFAKSIYLWSLQQGGYRKPPDAVGGFSSPDVLMAETDLHEIQLRRAVEQFYSVVSPTRVEDAAETVLRWAAYPAELCDRLVRKYLKSSAYKWLQRAHEAAADEEDAREQSGGSGSTVMSVEAVPTMERIREAARRHEPFHSLHDILDGADR